MVAKAVGWLLTLSKGTIKGFGASDCLINGRDIHEHGFIQRPKRLGRLSSWGCLALVNLSAATLQRGLEVVREPDRKPCLPAIAPIRIPCETTRESRWNSMRGCDFQTTSRTTTQIATRRGRDQVLPAQTIVETVDWNFPL